MPDVQDPSLRRALRGALTVRPVVGGVLLTAGPILAVAFGLYEAALAAFVVGVIVAPNVWFRGLAGSRDTSMESPGGF